MWCGASRYGTDIIIRFVRLRDDLERDHIPDEASGAMSWMIARAKSVSKHNVLSTSCDCTDKLTNSVRTVSHINMVWCGVVWCGVV